MANKNHALDNLIVDAAMKEFLQMGYEKASMRNIAAAAGVTIGAIYTRYSTKDILFCSLTEPLIEKIKAAFSGIKAEYYSGGTDPAFMARSMANESEAILHLLFDDYERAVLLLCRSRGSSLEKFFDAVIEAKISETLSFFKSSSFDTIDEGVVRLLINSQFHMYFQIINEGYRPADAKRIMNAAIVYNTGGWMALLNTGKNKDAAGGTI